MAKKAEETGPKVTKLQAFTMERVHRTQIQGAPYNPRTITTYERKRLGKLVQKLGLLGPITVNRTTGMTIVGGHQRLAALDAYEGSTDYLLDVAVVELTPAQEREANVGLNNPNIAGSFDLNKLEAMFKDDAVKIDTDLAGFDRTDLENMFGASFFGGMDEAIAANEAATAPIIAEVEAMAPPKATVEPTKAQIATSRRKEMKAELAEDTDVDTMVVVVFEKGGRDAADEFVKRCGYEPGTKYLDGTRVMEAIKP